MNKFVDVNLATSMGNERYEVKFRKRIKQKMTRNFILNLLYPDEKSDQTTLDSFPDSSIT